MITQQQLTSNFKVSGSYVTLKYEKFKTTELPEVKLFISNSSDTFGIQFYPTSSARLLFTKTDGSEVNQTYPIILPPNTGSNVNFVELTVNVNTSGFDELSNNTTQQFDIRFNAVAVTSSLITLEQASQFRPTTTGQTNTGGTTSSGGDNTGGTSSGGENTGRRGFTDDGTITPPGGDGINAI